MIFSSRELVHVPWDSSSIELVHVLPNFLWALYIWRHEKPFSCGECNRLYTTRQVLRIHYSKHTREKPFECNLCGKQFKINQQLRVHKAAGERNFLCSDCGNSFGSQSTNSLNSAVRDLLEFTRGRLVWFFKLLRMNTHYHPLTFFRERLDYSSNIHYTGKCLMRLNVTITIQLQSYCGSQIIGHPHKPEVHLLTPWDT